MIRKAKRSAEEDHPSTYLYRIVRNLALDQEPRGNFEVTLFVDNSQVALDSISSGKASLDRRAMAREELNRLKVAIAELPERTRVAVEMHRLGGFKLKQIAAHLGISISLAQLLVTEGISHCHDRLYEDEK